jgi:hypothetical protein
VNIAVTLFPKTACAYIDLGAGSYVMQLIFAFLASVAFFVNRHWKKMLWWFKKGSHVDD